MVISQLADDTTLFLRDAMQIPLAISVIKFFSKASGLHLNVQKCELLAIKNCNDSFIRGIPVKEKVCYLGVYIVKDQNERCIFNFQPLTDKIQKRFNQWLQRDLSLRGRVLLTKAEGLSRLIYAAQSVHLESKPILFKFLWINSIHYIRKSVVMNISEKGGLNSLCFPFNPKFLINTRSPEFKD